MGTSIIYHRQWGTMRCSIREKNISLNRETFSIRHFKLEIQKIVSNRSILKNLRERTSHILSVTFFVK